MSDNTYYVEITCKAVDATSEEVFEHSDSIATALFDLEDGAGASFSSDADALTVTFGFMLSGPNKVTALQKGLDLARTALHADGGSTPVWPNASDIEFEIVKKFAKTERQLANA